MATKGSSQNSPSAPVRSSNPFAVPALRETRMCAQVYRASSAAYASSAPMGMPLVYRIKPYPIGWTRSSTASR